MEQINLDSDTENVEEGEKSIEGPKEYVEYDDESKIKQESEEMEYYISSDSGDEVGRDEVISPCTNQKSVSAVIEEIEDNQTVKIPHQTPSKILLECCFCVSNCRPKNFLNHLKKVHKIETIKNPNPALRECLKGILMKEWPSNWKYWSELQELKKYLQNVKHDCRADSFPDQKTSGQSNSREQCQRAQGLLVNRALDSQEKLLHYYNLKALLLASTVVGNFAGAALQRYGPSLQQHQQLQNYGPVFQAATTTSA